MSSESKEDRHENGLGAASPRNHRTVRATARRYLPDFIFGANDGIITTFAVVSGVTGAGLDARIILILGFANLLADGFSMGASNYLSRRSRAGVQSGRARWQAISHGFTTFVAFIIAGAVPLIAYLVPIPADQQYPTATALTLLTLFGVGAARALVIEKRWWRSGLEMLLIGAAAAAVAFIIGGVVAILTNGNAAL